ncbi:hypothetical protein [Patulibacter sp. SYSU D01012]|uniref:hypothetical protein n=1 Tax=Patulibacter sp. SYSU D01012 TaxID=2817381 RepID=UPI001B30486E|nr:hypothetical protein [Patulibacter sp. SYSU D01012]
MDPNLAREGRWYRYMAEGGRQLHERLRVRGDSSRRAVEIIDLLDRRADEIGTPGVEQLQYPLTGRQVNELIDAGVETFYPQGRNYLQRE